MVGRALQPGKACEGMTRRLVSMLQASSSQTVLVEHAPSTVTARKAVRLCSTR